MFKDQEPRADQQESELIQLEDLFVVINAFGDRTDSPTDADRSQAVKFTHSFDS